MGLPDWVLNAIQIAPWDACVSKGFEHLAHADCGMPISNNRSTLAPIAMAMAIKAMAPKASDSVLEIGSSVMRMTSILSNLCCGVFVLESDNARYLADSELASELALRNVRLSLGFELPEDQLYDIIMLNSAVNKIPSKLLSMLHDNGRLCCVMERNLVLVKKSGSEFTETKLCEANLSKLAEFNHDEFEL